ncbi:MAG TPA: hypothetical protein VGM39_08770 [Kofleriaceae bacterium]|jgi:hypothetical protein
MLTFDVTICVLIINALGAGAIATSKNRNGFAWALAGFCMGPLALLMVGVETTLVSLSPSSARPSRLT